MAFSTEAAAVCEAQAMPRRRQYPRITLRSLAYVKLDHANGGIIRDLTESGIAIQAVGPLEPGQEAEDHFLAGFHGRIRAGREASSFLVCPNACGTLCATGF